MKKEYNFKYTSNYDGTCSVSSIGDFKEDVLEIPRTNQDGERVISIKSDVLRTNCFKVIILPETFSEWYASNWNGSKKLERIEVDPENPYYSSHDGILYDKKMTMVISCPSGRSGTVEIPSSVSVVRAGAFYECDHLDEIIFHDGLVKIEGCAFSYCGAIITLPSSAKKIDEEAFESEYVGVCSIIRAPRGSYMHYFAKKHQYNYMPSDCSITWDAEDWRRRFQNASGDDFRALRKEVWQNTCSIVEDGGYTLPNRISVMLQDADHFETETKFYRHPFTPLFEKLTALPEITVVSDDCLDVAHQWVSEGDEVCVLNMANRQNPGGGVINGAGAQEEYLFRCSNYYRSLYRYAPYAWVYGLTKSHYKYPMDKNYGGIYTPNVTIFRGNEETGYPLLEKSWQANFIAVAGMNSPEIVIENGRERIAPDLTGGVKNKIRTILRIACDRGQRNLVLGALGCGAFRNPPEHVAELFRDVLCECEFSGAFKKICFAVKTDHNSRQGTNFNAFHKVLHNFIPVQNNDKMNEIASVKLQLKKIEVARDFYALLCSDGSVRINGFYSEARFDLYAFHDIIDIAAGFDHILGLRRDGKVVSGGKFDQSEHARHLNWYGGIALSACEARSAVLRVDGTAVCEEDHHYLVQPYGEIVEKWTDLKQIVVTFEEPFGLTRQGKIVSRSKEIERLFNSRDKKIVRISAFGCYYSTITIAALYEDGTVKAWCDTEITEVSEWRNVTKICCGNHAAVVGLTDDGRVLFPDYFTYVNDTGVEITELDNIVDLAVNFDHLVAVDRYGRIICLKKK